MAYNTSPGRAEYVATAAQTNFPFSFKIFTETDIKVYQTPVGNAPNDANDILTYITDYTVTINGDLGGEIVLVSGAPLGDAVTLVRSLPVERSIEYQTSGDLLASTLNMDLNFNTYLTADREQIGNRYVSIPESAQNVSTDLPDVSPDSYLVWNSAGDALVNDTTIPDGVATTEANKVAAEDSNLEAASWANEAEDAPVKEYTSGMPSNRVPTVYSAKHWAIKAQDAVIGDVEFRDTEWRVFDDLDNTKKIAFQASALTTATTRTITMPDADVDLTELIDGPKLWGTQTTTHNFTSDADYTLTTEQNKFGRIIITDTGVLLTTARNIIVDSSVREFIAKNETAQTLFFKMSTGLAVPVMAGDSQILYSDGTNVLSFSNGQQIKNQCTAWVNFNGSTGAILDSYNVSTVTRTDVGDYTITFSTQMDNINYVVAGTGVRPANAESDFYLGLQGATTTPITVASVKVGTKVGSNGASTDATIATVMIFGGKD